jgi:site-specific recombinase XerC
MLNEVKHLAIAREILRCAQNDIVHHLTCDKAIVVILYCIGLIWSNMFGLSTQKIKYFPKFS